jgi:hypothetical protein
VLLAGCSGPPWFMGKPLDGRVSIPPTSASLSWVQKRDLAEHAAATGETVIEIQALLGLEEAVRLDAAERARLAELIARRAADFHARGRAVPENRDLRILARLGVSAPGLPPIALARARAGAERAAGDAWLAIGALPEAIEAYEQAAVLGAPGIDFRLRAAAAQPPPPETPAPELERAIAELPLRAVPLVASAYVAQRGSDPATLERALAAARQEGMTSLAQRISATLAPSSSPSNGDGDGDGDDNADADGVIPPPPPPPIPPNLDAWLLAGPSLSGRLLPLVAAHPELLDDHARARRWVDLLLVEDPTSQEVLELAALAFGRSGRTGGTERMLMELAYYSPDRALGLARGAAVWERLGRTRQACAQWIKAARWRDDPEDPIWRNAVSCTRRDPGAGDWHAIRQYVLDRARPERREAIAASLDAVLPVEVGVNARAPAPERTTGGGGATPAAR